MTDSCTLWTAFDEERPEDVFWALGRKDVVDEVRHNLDWDGVEPDEFDARVHVTSLEVQLTPAGVLDLMWRVQ